MALSGDPIIPADVNNIHVFAIKQNRAGTWEAFVGYTFDNGNFQYQQIRVESAVITQIQNNI